MVQAIKCEGLTKHFGSVAAVDNLDLLVDEGAIFGFLGPNGAGKTTTVRMLAGLSRPTRGRAWVLGEGVDARSVSWRSRMGYLPEEPSFYNWMNGRQFLTYVGDLFRMSTIENKKRCDELLEFAGLKEAASRRIGGYSKGMRQRLGLAQALMNRPKVLFLDEPCSGLDPIGRREVLDTILRLKGQTTVFMSTHILSDVERICDMVGIIDRGRLVIEEGKDKLLERFAPPVFELHLEGDPQAVRRVLSSLPWVVKCEEGKDKLLERFAPPVFELHLEGDPQIVIRVLTSLPWVVKCEEEQHGAEVMLRIRTSDMAAAKRELPRIVADSGLGLLHYELVSPSLEDVFIQLVGHKAEQ